jgi:DNA-binding MarR family transcriptional regulator
LRDGAWHPFGLKGNHLVAYWLDAWATCSRLADPSRRPLLDRLHERGGQTLSELPEGLRMSRQAVTKHLAVLEAARRAARKTAP